jgi:hypothetical protein
LDDCVAGYDSSCLLVVQKLLSAAKNEFRKYSKKEFLKIRLQHLASELNQSRVSRRKEAEGRLSREEISRAEASKCGCAFSKTETSVPSSDKNDMASALIGSQGCRGLFRIFE